MADSDTNTPAPEGQADETGRVGNTVAATWSVSLEDLRANISHTSKEAQDLIVWSYLWCTDPAHSISRQEFAVEVGIDHTTVLKVLRGTYKDPETKERLPISENMVRGMKLFRERQLSKDRATRVGFVMTPTAKKIWEACDLARESQSPVFIIGPSHLGKTVALESYTDEHNHGRTVYVRLRAASGLHGMIKAIAEAIGGIGKKGNCATLTDSIKKKLTSRMLLILDEVHELVYTYRKESFFACLEVIREIYDETDCGIVLCGTKLLLKRINDDRGELEQLLRRGVHKFELPDQPTKGDLAAILATVGLEFPEKDYQVEVTVGGEKYRERPYEMLRQVGLLDGLKAITERVRYGQKFARKAHASLAWSHVVAAHFTIRANGIAKNDWEEGSAK